jgi:hypothetical protein
MLFLIVFFLYFNLTYCFLLHQFLTFTVDQIKAAHELWFSKNSKVNDRKQQEREKAKKAQEIIIDDNDADLTDIDKLFAERHQGPHMLEIDFEPVGEPTEYPSQKTGQPTQCWTWKHKLTGHEIKRYRTASGKAWDTGKLSLYLLKLKESTHKIAYQRALHILRLNKKNVRITEDEGCFAVAVGKGEDKESLVKQWVSKFGLTCVIFFPFSNNVLFSMFFSFSDPRCYVLC